MVLRRLLHYLANNEKMIEKIAESYPVRRAAQIAVSLYYKSQEKASKIDKEKVNSVISFLKRFSNNMKDGIEDAKNQLKKK